MRAIIIQEISKILNVSLVPHLNEPHECYGCKYSPTLYDIILLGMYLRKYELLLFCYINKAINQFMVLFKMSVLTEVSRVSLN